MVVNTTRVKEHALKVRKQANWNESIEFGVHPIFEVAFDSENLLHIEKENEIIGDLISVEIPSNFSVLKGTKLALAQEWRMQTRHLFQRSFTDGYTVVDFVTK